MNSKDAIEKVDRYIRARYPLIVVTSYEEDRVIRAIKSIAGTRSDLRNWTPHRIAEWSVTTGLTGLDDVNPDETADPNAALRTLCSIPVDSQPLIVVLKDFHKFLDNAMIERSLRDLASHFGKSKHTALFISPNFSIPSGLEKTMVMVDWPFPDEGELSGILEKVERSLPSNVPVTLNGNRERVIQALRGLTEFEATSVLLSAVAATRSLGDDVIPHIIGEKKQIVQKAGVLEYFDTDVTMQQVGGLPYLKEYAEIKRGTFSRQAKEFGVEPARGILLLGLPGTGKSLTAKAIAGGQMPLLRMDVGALMGSLVGESESNTRNALKVAEAVAPCVLWIDECEKALGGSGEHDGGTSMRVLGTILTFMQETKAPIYFVGTANDVRVLRPELIGRFDDTIFCDLPNHHDRAEIVAVHLTKRGRNPQDYDLNAIAASTWGFVGREIERVVKSGLEQAFFRKETLTTTHLIDAATRMVPISVTMGETIKDLRNWAKGRAILASDPIESNPTIKGSTQTVDL